MYCLKFVLTAGWPDFFGSPILKSPPIVNGPAHKNLLSRAFEEHVYEAVIKLESAHSEVFTPADSSFAIVSAAWWRVATQFHRSLTIGGKENRSGARRLWKGSQVNGRASGST